MQYRQWWADREVTQDRCNDRKILWGSSIKYGEAERSWSAPTHADPAWSRSIEMEITFYLQFQHPSCSPQEPDWDLPCLSWVTL